MKHLPRILLLVPFLILFCLTLYLSLKASPEMKSVSWIPPFLAEWADRNSDLRTAVPYALLGIMVSWITSNQKPGRRRQLLIGVGVLVFLLLATESMQLLLQGRTGSWQDLAWGMAGIAGGAAVGFALNRAFGSIAPVHFLRRPPAK